MSTTVNGLRGSEEGPWLRAGVSGCAGGCCGVMQCGVVRRGVAWCSRDGGRWWWWRREGRGRWRWQWVGGHCVSIHLRCPRRLIPALPIYKHRRADVAKKSPASSCGERCLLGTGKPAGSIISRRVSRLTCNVAASCERAPGRKAGRRGNAMPSQLYEGATQASARVSSSLFRGSHNSRDRLSGDKRRNATTSPSPFSPHPTIPERAQAATRGP